MDLVVCRNLLIYFRPELQQEILDVFAYALHQTSGYLFLGKAETARPSKSTFEVLNKKYKVYRCIAGPGGHLKPARPARPLPETRPAANNGAPAPPPEAMDVGHLRRFNELILRSMPVGLVVIDRNYRMITSNPAARRLLQIHDHANEPDFLHAVHGIPYNEVRAAIDVAFRDRNPAILPELKLTAAGEERFVHVSISRILADPASGEYAVVSIMDVTETVRGSRRLHSSQEEQKLLVEEVSSSNKRLADVNKDLQDANEELQAANEELMLAQEEMQATNEEFEATNEELQATNEELETNNEEMQATNEELETTNEELTARSAELQELTRILTAERAGLAEMVELAPFCMLVMKGTALLIDAVNPAAASVLATEEARHRPFEEVFTRDADVASAVRTAFREDKLWTSGPREVTLDEGGRRVQRRFVFSAVPTHEEGKTDGIVLYGEDVTGAPEPH